MNFRFSLFGREWQKDGDVLRNGDAAINLATQRGSATPTGTSYSIKGKRALRALEMEIRASQDTERELLDWFTEQFPDLVVEYGSQAVVISRLNDAYGVSTVFLASGKTLQDAVKDFAQRL